jgi:hypothetical protein
MFGDREDRLRGGGTGGNVVFRVTIMGKGEGRLREKGSLKQVAKV